MLKIKENFAAQASLLAAGTIICKVIGAVYRVPLTNALGGEGIGLYQMIYSVYALFCVLASGGIASAVAKLTAEDVANGLSGKRHLRLALIFSAAISIVLSLLLFFLNGTISRWQGNTDAALGYMIIAPSVFLMSLSTAFKGYFQGKMNMLPTVISNLIEQGIKLAIGLFLSFYLLRYGILYSVCGAVASVTIGEFITLVYVAITYLVEGKRYNKCEDGRINAKKFFKIVSPYFALGLMLPLSQLIDSFIIINLLNGGEIATALYGVYSGASTTIINMPIMLLISLTIAIVPSVSKGFALRDEEGIIKKTELSIKLCLYIGIPIMLFLILFSHELTAILYPKLNPELQRINSLLITVLAINVVTMSLFQIIGSVLCGLEKTGWYCIALIIGVAVKVVFLFALIKPIGIMGAAIGAVALSIVTLVINVLRLNYLIGTRFDMVKNSSLILFSSVIIALIGLPLKLFLDNIYLKTMLALIICSALYVFLTILFNVFSIEETKSLPLSKGFLKLKKLIRFWDKEV